MTKERINEFLRSRLFMGIVTGIGITLVAVCIFEAGVAVGYHEASFSSQWGKNYSMNFGVPGVPSSGMTSSLALPDMHGPNPDGLIGKIIRISPSSSAPDSATGTTTMIVASSQKPEESVLVTSDTLIRDRENTVSISALTVGSYAVVLGTPTEDGEINAKLIRLMPASMQRP